MEYFENNLDIIALCLFAVIGISLCIYNTYLIFKGQKTFSWTSTHGKIIKSEMQISKSLGEGTYGDYYRANIEYEYLVSGKRLTSNQAYLGDKVYLSHKRKAKRTLEQFPINKQVKVYVNPYNKTDSVLIKGAGGNRISIIILGLILIFLGIFIQSNFELIKQFFLSLES